jgi:hypothetical protein
MQSRRQYRTGSNIMPQAAAPRCLVKAKLPAELPRGVDDVEGVTELRPALRAAPSLVGRLEILGRRLARRRRSASRSRQLRPDHAARCLSLSWNVERSCRADSRSDAFSDHVPCGSHFLMNVLKVVGTPFDDTPQNGVSDVTSVTNSIVDFVTSAGKERETVASAFHQGSTGD